MRSTAIPSLTGPCARRAAGALLLVVLAAGCSHDNAPSARGSWKAVFDTVGDTIVVRTVSGSVWGAPAQLVEEVSIGSLDGAEEQMFGFITAVAPDRSGGVYVFDGQAPALRHYDASGRYVRTLGGEGSGPGEYHDDCLGIAIRTDGRIVMRDPRNARLNVYDPDGRPFAQWPVSSGLYTDDALTVDTTDQMYLRTLTELPQPNKPWHMGLLHLDAVGTLIDTIPDPRVPGEPTTDAGMFSPRKVWAFSRYDDMVVGINDQYAFEVRRPDGRVVRIEKAYIPVPVGREEKAEYEAEYAWRRKHGWDETGSLPDTKPAYRILRVGQHGRIWVGLHTRAEKVDAPPATTSADRPPPITWQEPGVFDVFQRDGTYLGQVHMPPRTVPAAFVGDTVWAIRRGDMDEQYVVRFRLVHTQQSM